MSGQAQNNRPLDSKMQMENVVEGSVAKRLRCQKLTAGGVKGVDWDEGAIKSLPQQMLYFMPQISFIP